MFVFLLLAAACRILVPQPGTELAPPAVEAVLTTGSPGKSLGLILDLSLYFYVLHHSLCKLEAKTVPTSEDYCEDNRRNMLSLEFGILCVCVQSFSHALLFATPWTVA